MKKRLQHIAPVQCGVVLGALYAAISLIFVPFILLITMMAPKNGNNLPFAGAGIFLVILIPVLYGVLGFIGGIISAAIYNLIASWTGGLEFTVVDAPGSQIV
jgi:hypothetical protein